MIIDNVIDYLHVNFKDLAPSKRYIRKGGASLNNSPIREHDEDTTDVENTPLESVETSPKRQLTTKQATALIAKKKKEMAKKAFTQKLARMGIMPSNALNFKK